MENLSNEELEERVAILKRFRFLLEQQRNKFKEYLEVLEKQEEGIISENDTVISAQSELEQQIVSNITNLQKVIVPIEKLYKEKGITLTAEIPEIQKELSNLQQAVLTQKSAVEKFLPKMMSKEEIKEEMLKLEDKSIGGVMKHFKLNFAGKCDMRDVQEVLKSL